MTETIIDVILTLWDSLKLMVTPVVDFLITPLKGFEIPVISNIFDFIVELLDKIPIIPDYSIAILAALDSSPLELFFGLGITFFLGYTIITWVLNIVT